MGWTETCAVEQRMRFVIAAEKQEESFAGLCRRFGVSRRVGYKWLARYREASVAGLLDRSRAPLHHPHAIADEIAVGAMMRSTSTRRWSANQSLLRKTPPAGPSAMGRSRSARSPTTTTVFENPNDSPVDIWTMQAHRPQAHRTNNNRPEQNRNCVTYVVGQKCYLCRRLLTRIGRCAAGEGDYPRTHLADSPPSPQPSPRKPGEGADRRRGWLRYLEYYEFRLVREALIERELLWQIAPHIIRPLRFVLPHHDGLRPTWLLRLGLFLYDHIGGRKLLPPARSVDLTKDEVGKPLIPGRYTKGFEYSDCFVDDARLVLLNARDAANRGADIRTRSRAVHIAQSENIWHVTVEDTASGQRSTIAARALVNAAGPWVDAVLASGAGVNARAKVRLVQGSHIVVPKLYDHDRAYMFQNSDGRIVFVIPYQDDFTLIGTTDRDYDGDPAAVKATADEIGYLCRSVSEYLAKPVTPDDVVWTYAGVRPLYDDGASEAKAATRDYVFELDTPGGAPLLSIYGGKITTYRRLAEEALERLAPWRSEEHRVGKE